jgi:hypothetical protein
MLFAVELGVTFGAAAVVVADAVLDGELVPIALIAETR